MQKKFTNRLIQLLAAAINWRKPVAIATLLAALITTGVYLRAAITDTKAPISVSSDTAVNGPVPTYTSIGNIVFREQKNSDFVNGSSAILNLTAPAGWKFNNTSVVTAVASGDNNQPSNVSITSTGSYNNTATVISIPYTVSKENRLDLITISGVQIIPLDGNNLANSGYITLDVSDRTKVTGTIFPLNVVNLSQTIGSPNKLAFISQPSDAVAGQSIGNFSVEVKDYFGRKLSNANNAVTIAISNNPGGGTLSGTVTASANSGVANFSGNSINNAGIGYTLFASASGLTNAISDPFTISVPKPLIISITPCLSAGDQATDITVNGNNFASGAEVLVNNIAKATTFVNANLLTFSFTAEELSSERNFSIVVKNPNGDLSVAEALAVNAVPRINAPIYTAAGNTSICANNKGVRYSAPAEYGASYYTWSVVSGNATIASGNNTSDVYVDFGNTGGEVVLKVIPYNACGKTGTDNPAYSTITIQVTPPPTVVTNPPAAVCGPATIDLTAPAITSGSDPNLTFNYYTDKDATLAVSDPTKVGNGIYYIKGTSRATGCSAITPVTVTVISPPVVKITNPAPVCSPTGSPATIDLTAAAITNGSDANLTFTYYSAYTSEAVNTPISLADAKAITTSGTYYIKGFNGECAAVEPVIVTINPLPATPTISGLTPGATYFTGQDPINFTLSAAPTGTTAKLTSTAGVSGNTFSPCAAVGATESISEAGKAITLTYTITDNTTKCESKTEIVFFVKRSTYSVINRADPFPICKGQNTLYTAYVYRDVQVVDVRDSRHPQHAEWRDMPSTDFRKISYYRYWQPDVVRLDGKSATLATPATVSDLLQPATLFNYDWMKNGISIQANAQTTKQAGLSATDEYYVVVTLKSPNTLPCNGNTFNFPIKQDLLESDKVNQKVVAPVAGESNHLWYSTPPTYTFNVTALTPVCVNQLVTITATADYGGLALTGLQLYFYKTDAVSGKILQLNATPKTTSPATINLTSSITRNDSDPNIFSDGDIISVGWVTDQVKCITKGTTESQITMRVALPQTLSNAGSYCPAPDATGVPISISGSQTGITYELINAAGTVVSTQAGTGNSVNFGSFLAGTYTVRPVVATGSCPFGSVTIYESPVPTVFNVTGGGSYCANGTGVAIGLSGSQTNVTYQLIRTINNITSNVGSPVRGTGSAFSFGGNFTEAGDYTVLATIDASAPTTSACPKQMASSAQVTINPLPVAPGVTNVNYCQNQTPATLSATLTGIGTSLRWYTTADAPANQALTIAPTPSTATVGTTSYWVSQVTDNGCEGPRAQIVVTVYELPIAPGVTNLSYCQNQSASALTATGTNLKWYSTADATSPLASAPTPNTSTVGTTSYWVSQTNTNGCEGPRAEFKVTITAPITWTLELTSEPEFGEIEMGKEVTYTATAFTTDPVTLVRTPLSKANYRWEVYLSNVDVPNDDDDFEVKQNGLSNTFTMTVPTVEDTDPDFVMNVRVFVTTNPTDYCTEQTTRTAESGNKQPLPVELLYLTAEKQANNVVALEWATAMEQNSEGFEVQVSQDAKTYRTLAFVASKAGGNTNQKQVYAFYDKENGKYGTRYYRLKQRDMNGDFEYFGPKAVKLGEVAASLSAYPNPFTSQVTLAFNAPEAGNMHVLVTNAVGTKVLERTWKVEKGSNQQSLQLNSSLPQGVYIITTRLNGQTSHLKLVKQQ